MRAIKKMNRPHFVPEITPLVLNPKLRRTGSATFCNGTASPAEEIRALCESQILSMKSHSEWIGADFDKIRVTGGASKSNGFVQTIANIFQTNVERISIPDSAALGAAIRAANAVGSLSFTELYDHFTKPTECFVPDRNLKPLYENLLQQFKALEK